MMTLKKVLRGIALTGIFLLPFVPLIVSASLFFPFITAKNFVFRIIVELIAASWLALAIMDPQYRPKRSWVLYAFAAFAVLLGISDLFGVNPMRSIWSNFERMEGWVTIAHLGLYLVAAGTILQSEKLWKRLFQTSAGVSLILGIYGLFQLFGAFEIHQGGVRLDATFGNATYLAVYMLIHIFLTLWLLYKEEGSKALRYTYIGLIVLQAITLYYTATRGAILGLIGGLFIAALIIIFFGKTEVRLRKWSIWGMGIVLIVVAIFFAVRNTSFVQKSETLSRFATISVTDRTTQSRFLIWSMAFDGFKERPLLGWGQDNFIYAFGKYYRPQMWNQEPWFDRAHNVFFDWLIAGGLLGLLSYLSLFVAALIAIWKSPTFTVPERAIFTGLLAGYFFHNIFVFDNITSYILFATVLAFVHAHSTYGREGMVMEGKVLSEGTQYGLLSAVGVVTLVAVYMLNAPGLASASDLLQALSPQDKGITENLNYYKKVLDRNSFGSSEATEQLGYAAATVVGLQGATPQLKQSFVSAAQNAFEAEMKSDPLNPRTPFFYGIFAKRLGDFEKSIPILEKAAALTPNRQPALFELGLAYVGTKQYDKGLAILKKAYELDPTYDAARVEYAVGAVYAGKNDLVASLLVPKFGSIIVDDDQLAQAYLAMGQKANVLAIWKLRVSKSPNDVQTHISLAAAYLLVGDRSSAIAEIQKSIALDARFKTQGEQIIKDIQSGKQF